MIEKYLKLYPEQESDILAALNLWGESELDIVIKMAIQLNKKIKFKDPDPDFMDLLEYELVKP